MTHDRTIARARDGRATGAQVALLNGAGVPIVRAVSLGNLTTFAIDYRGYATVVFADGTRYTRAQFERAVACATSVGLTPADEGTIAVAYEGAQREGRGDDGCVDAIAAALVQEARMTEGDAQRHAYRAVHLSK